jgi:hypothetical protein
MTMNNSVEDIESRRLDALEQQAALYGPQTDPAILIEIAELRSKRRHSSSTERRQFVSGLDYQFLMDVVAAALVRLGAVETALSNNDKKRILRQLIHDFWMVAISVIVFLTLLLQLRGH